MKAFNLGRIDLVATTGLVRELSALLVHEI
jgi:hypothetical protein